MTKLAAFGTTDVRFILEAYAREFFVLGLINPWNMYNGAYVPNWLLRRRELSHGAKLAYARLMQFAGRRGVAFPYMATLAGEIGVDERQCRRYVEELVRYDLILVEDQRHLHKPNRYRFAEHSWQTDLGDDDGDDRTSTEGDRSHLTGPTGHIRQTDRSHLTGPIEESHEENQGEENHLPTEGMGSGTPEARSTVNRGTPRLRSRPEARDSDQTEEEIRRPQPKGETRKPGEVKNPRNPISNVDLAEEVRERIARARSGGAALSDIAKEATARVAKQARERAEKALSKHQDQIQRSSGGDGSFTVRKAAIASVEASWRNAMGKYHPDVPLAAEWAGKERGQAENLISKYGPLVLQAIPFMVQHWAEVSKATVGKEVAVPTLGFLVSNHDRIVPMAAEMAKHTDTLAEVEAWYTTNPSRRPPAELDDRRKAADDALARLGITVKA